MKLSTIKQAGQAIVELALMTPLVLVTLYIPVDFGIAFYTAHLAQNAVREGARIGSGLISSDSAHPITSTEGTIIKNAVFDRLPQSLSSPTVTVKFYFTSTAATCMQVVEVSATGAYQYGWYHLLGLIGISFDTPRPINPTTQMRYNYQRPENNAPSCGPTDFNQTYSS